MSWNFVQAWTQAPDQDPTIDQRGWINGQPRRHPAELRARIAAIRDTLDEDPKEFYVGDSAIQQEYEDRYPTDPIPGLRYINEILRAIGRIKPRKKKRRGTAKYLCYPVECVARLGNRIAEVDFIQKFLKGVTDPLHFLSVAFKKPAKIRRIVRTETETTPEAIHTTTAIFDHVGWPDAVRVDPGNVFSGRGERNDGKGRRSIPTYAQFLLEKKIIPVYGAIRSPWNQAHVEGTNSTFGRNFWEARLYTSVEDVDQQLAAFNVCSLKRARWERWERDEPDTSWIPRICFIRKVEEDSRTHKGIIPIASTLVQIRKTYISLFVFAEWNLKTQTLTIFFEREGSIRTLKTIPFPIHSVSKKRCSHFIG